MKQHKEGERESASEKKKQKAQLFPVFRRAEMCLGDIR